MAAGFAGSVTSSPSTGSPASGTRVGRSGTAGGEVGAGAPIDGVGPCGQTGACGRTSARTRAPKQARCLLDFMSALPSSRIRSDWSRRGGCAPSPEGRAIRLAAAPTRESRHPEHSPGARAAWTFIGNVQAHFESSIRPRMRWTWLKIALPHAHRGFLPENLILLVPGFLVSVVVVIAARFLSDHY